MASTSCSVIPTLTLRTFRSVGPGSQTRASVSRKVPASSSRARPVRYVSRGTGTPFGSPAQPGAEAVQGALGSRAGTGAAEADAEDTAGGVELDKGLPFLAG